MGTVRIPLSSRKYPNLYALIDDDDYELVSQYKWFPHGHRKTRYAMAYTDGGRANKQSVFMHRLILQPPQFMMVDHIDGNGLNNTRVNLRLATHQQNTAYMSKRIDNSSGFKGVGFHRASGLWRVQLQCAGERFTMYAKTPADAARMYDEKAIELFGEFALTNEMLGLLDGS